MDHRGDDGVADGNRQRDHSGSTAVSELLSPFVAASNNNLLIIFIRKYKAF